jgi:hypothetical protein
VAEVTVKGVSDEAEAMEWVGAVGDRSGPAWLLVIVKGKVSAGHASSVGGRG